MKSSLGVGAALTIIYGFLVYHRISPIIASKLEIWNVYSEEILMWLGLLFVSVSGLWFVLIGSRTTRQLRHLAALKQGFESGKFRVRR